MGHTVPQGEGEQMVMDLQDVGVTLEDSVAQSQIRLFGSSSNHLAVGPSQNDVPDEEDQDDQDLHSEDPEESDEQSDVGSEDIESSEGTSDDFDEPQNNDCGRSTMRNPHRSTRNMSSVTNSAGKDVEYADSDSDIGDDFDNDRIPDDDDEGDDIPDDEDEAGHENDEGVPRWK